MTQKLRQIGYDVREIAANLITEPEWFAKEHRSYFVWKFDKVPEVAVEIVSNRKGGELDLKMNRYARMGLNYYVVFDPFRELGAEALRVFEIGFHRYKQREDLNLPEMGLSLTLWRDALARRIRNENRRMAALVRRKREFNFNRSRTRSKRSRARRSR